MQQGYNTCAGGGAHKAAQPAGAPKTHACMRKARGLDTSHAACCASHVAARRAVAELVDGRRHGVGDDVAGDGLVGRHGVRAARVRAAEARGGWDSVFVVFSPSQGLLRACVR